MTLSIKALNIMKFITKAEMALLIMPLSIMTLSITTLNITIKIQHSA
jgi:hypothetical protein